MKSEDQRYLYARMERGDFAYQLNPFSLPSIIRAVKIVLSIPDAGKGTRWVMALHVSRFYVLLLWFCSVLATGWWLANNIDRLATGAWMPLLLATGVFLFACLNICVCALFAKPKG